MPGISAARRRLLQLNQSCTRQKTCDLDIKKVVQLEEPIKQAGETVNSLKKSRDEFDKENTDFGSGWPDEQLEQVEPQKDFVDDDLAVETSQICLNTKPEDPVKPLWDPPLDHPSQQSTEETFTAEFKDKQTFSDAKTTDQKNTDSDTDEWNELGKVPFDKRKRFLRQMTTVPIEPTSDTVTSSIEVKKHRIQMLLAEHKFGIPSLALADEYEKMYGQKFDVQDWGYEMLSDMITDMSDIITVQEADEISCLYHPKYSNDRILLDKRYGYQFDSRPAINTDQGTSTSGVGTSPESDFESLISKARINHDCEFPDDVVLPGEQYTEPILIKTAQIEGTRGVYTCLITGAANPNHFYVNVKNDYTETIETFTSQVKEYFATSEQPLEAYTIPEEFIYPGFACLRQRNGGPWERVSITGRSPTDNKILVESVDFGGTDAVDKKDLRLMPRKFMAASRQAIVVSMFGVKPHGDKWSPFSGQKIAGWSYEYYWMECLFLEPRLPAPSSRESSICDAESAGFETGSTCSVAESRKMSINRRIWYRKPQYEVVILDRMIPSYDAFIDEILVAQMLADHVPESMDELNRLKQQLKNVLKDIPPHENPMEKSFKLNGYV